MSTGRLGCEWGRVTPQLGRRLPHVCLLAQLWGKYHKEFSRGHAFPENGEHLVARALLRCNSCRALFDPFSGLYVEMGNPAAVPPDIPIIRPSSE